MLIDVSFEWERGAISGVNLTYCKDLAYKGSASSIPKSRRDCQMIIIDLIIQNDSFLKRFVTIK